MRWAQCFSLRRFASAGFLHQGAWCCLRERCPMEKPVEDTCETCGRSNANTTVSRKSIDFVDTYSERSDIVFVIGSKRFPAHRSVVAASSPVLHALLTNGMRESRASEVCLEDVDPTCWDISLQFMYAGCVHNLDEQTAVDLVILADRFELTKLMFIVDKFLAGVLRTSQLYESLEFAEQFELSQLRNAVRQVVHDDFLKLSREPDFSKLSFDVFKDILRSDELKVQTEIQIFDAILRWAEPDQDEESQDAIGPSSNEFNAIIERAEKNRIRIERQQQAFELLNYLKVSLMNADDIRTLWASPLVRMNPNLTDSLMKHMVERFTTEDGIRIKPSLRRELIQPVYSFAFSHTFFATDLPAGDWKCAERVYSPWKCDGSGRQWRLMVFFEGNMTTNDVSIYLERSSSDEVTNVTFRLFLMPSDIEGEKPPITKSAAHRFSNREPDWGFCEFIEKSVIYDPSKGFLNLDPEALTFGANLIFTFDTLDSIES